MIGLIIERGRWPVFIGMYLLIFMIGAAFQLYWDRIRWIVEGKALVWLVVYIGLGWIATEKYGVYLDFTSVSMWTVGIAILMGATIMSCAYTSHVLAHRLLRGADISYGVYLWHMPVIWTLAGFGFEGSWLVAFLALAVTLCLAIGSWFLIEKPAQRLKVRFARASSGLESPTGK